MRRLLMLLLVLPFLLVTTPAAACGAELDGPYEAEWWINPGYGMSEGFEVTASGYLVIEAISPPERSLETVTLWVSKPTPGGCNSAHVGALELNEEPSSARFAVEPGTYYVGALMSNRTHYIHADDPMFRRLVLVNVRFDPQG